MAADLTIPDGRIVSSPTTYTLQARGGGWKREASEERGRGGWGPKRVGGVKGWDR